MVTHIIILYITSSNVYIMGSPACSVGKESACSTGDSGLIPGLEYPLEESMETFLPGESPWTEKPDGLQSMGSQRVIHD